jgi:hypothetical protein
VSAAVPLAIAASAEAAPAPACTAGNRGLGPRRRLFALRPHCGAAESVFFRPAKTTLPRAVPPNGMVKLQTARFQFGDAIWASYACGLVASARSDRNSNGYIEKRTSHVRKIGGIAPVTWHCSPGACIEDPIGSKLSVRQRFLRTLFSDTPDVPWDIEFEVDHVPAADAAIAAPTRMQPRRSSQRRMLFGLERLSLRAGPGRRDGPTQGRQRHTGIKKGPQCAGDSASALCPNGASDLT